MARWHGSESERFLEEHEGCFQWFVLIVAVGLVLRFLYDYLSGNPWSSWSPVPETSQNARLSNSRRMFQTRSGNPERWGVSVQS